VNPNDTPRRYVITHGNKWVDTLELIHNDEKLEGKNQIGTHVWAQRIATADTVQLASPAGAANQVELVSKIGVSTTAAVLAPLNVSFRDIRPDLLAMRDNLRDEAVQKPVASAATYQLGTRLCDAWLSAVAERDARRREFGANAPAVRDLEHSKKTTLHFWDDLLTFDREVKDAHERSSTEKQKSAFFSDAQKNNWNTRAAALRPGLESLYAQFREARRQGAPAGAK
jgi:hypothetical protein